MVFWSNSLNKELLTLRNHFVVTKKFLKAKFDCIWIVLLTEKWQIYIKFIYTRAQNVCPGWPVYEVKQPQEKWACDFHDDAPPLSFQLQVAEVIF